MNLQDYCNILPTMLLSHPLRGEGDLQKGDITDLPPVGDPKAKSNKVWWMLDSLPINHSIFQ